MNNINKGCFSSFGVEYIPKKIKSFVGDVSIIINIYRIQANNLIMCEYFRIGFINMMFKGTNLTDFKTLYSPKSFKDSGRVILN